MLVVLVAVFIIFGVAGHREGKRRKALPLEEQKRLEHEDAVWSQRYGF
jgi:hypothetical protein